MVSLASLSPSQKRALIWLAQSTRTGEGTVDRRGVVVAAGERGKFLPETWLRLFTFGLLESAGDSRLRLTGAGMAAANKLASRQ